MKEVVEDCSTYSVINIGNIQDVAFVFHAKALEKEYINCAGMTWGYYTHYHLCGNGRLVAMDYCIHLLFSNVCMEGYPSRLLYFILEVKSNVEKLVNDSK